MFEPESQINTNNANTCIIRRIKFSLVMRMSLCNVEQDSWNVEQDSWNVEQDSRNVEQDSRNVEQDSRRDESGSIVCIIIYLLIV